MDLKSKKYKDGRFEFVLYINDFIICRRTFDIDDYIEKSMNSTEFRIEADSVVELIKNDLRSKSNVYTWYYADQDGHYYEDNILNQPLPPEWEYTFKFVVIDNGRYPDFRRRRVYCRIWDGGVYPKPIRDRVDISNRTLRMMGKDGNSIIIDIKSYFEENKDRLSNDMYIKRAIYAGRDNLIDTIIKTFQDTCSPKNGSEEDCLDEVFTDPENGWKIPHMELTDYTMDDTFQNADGKTVRYTHNIGEYNRRLMYKWTKAASKAKAKKD